MIETPPTRSTPERSPDGLWEWNGTQWIPVQPPPGPQSVAQSTPLVQDAPAAQAAPPVPVNPIETPPAPSAQRSADGLWEWNGTQWMPVHPIPGPQQVAQSTTLVHDATPVQTLPLAQPVAPVRTPQVSPDGQYQWNGTAWIPVKKKGHLIRNVGILVGALLLVGIGGAIASSGGSNNNSTAGTTTASSPAVTAAATAKATAAATAKATATPTAAAGPTLTNQQQNAVRSAREYLNLTAFSRQGLIDQLSSPYGSGYSVNDATVAVDSLNVDWNAEAVQSAKEYLKLTAFSCNGLIQQLDSPYGGNFTVAQATYGAQQAGAC